MLTKPQLPSGQPYSHKSAGRKTALSETFDWRLVSQRYVGEQTDDGLTSAYGVGAPDRILRSARQLASGNWRLSLEKAVEDHMSDGLKWARRLRLDLAVEIQQLANGVRKVTQVTAQGPVDVTEQTLATLQERFGHLEDMIAALEPRPGFV